MLGNGNDVCNVIDHYLGKIFEGDDPQEVHPKSSCKGSKEPNLRYYLQNYFSIGYLKIVACGGAQNNDINEKWSNPCHIGSTFR
jgi:hypothetical protein